MLSQQINESIAEISVRRLAIIIQIQIQNWRNENDKKRHSYASAKSRIGHNANCNNSVQ